MEKGKEEEEKEQLSLSRLWPAHSRAGRAKRPGQDRTGQDSREEDRKEPAKSERQQIGGELDRELDRVAYFGG